ncbi:hypothetical protein DITRI_Ditri06bG0140700 [Diplodiscus trichospermus]
MKFLRLWILLMVLLITIKSKAVVGAKAQPSSKEAYVTLLYGDEFLLGVRVLGKSIRDTGSTKDMVVLVSDGVSNYAKKLLKADGWIVEKISLLANPNQVRPKRFWGVYTKLKIFNMTNYKKGVMVVEPSEAVFNDMMSKVNTLPSYTGGDQGFLNSYYSDFPNAHVFDPNLPQEVLKSRTAPQMERLSTLYNADVGLYMLANKWMVDESELRVIHYTLGPLKPWDWWTSWLLKPVDVWQNVREQLEETLPGTGGGKNPNDELLVKVLFLLPFCALLFCYYRSFLQTGGSFCRTSLCNQIRHLYYVIRSSGTVAYTGVSSSSTINANSQFPNGAQTKVPAYLGGISVFVCFMAALVSLGIAIAIVPRQVLPWTGLLLMYEWTFTIFFLLFGAFLHLIYQWGRRTATQLGSFSSLTDSFDSDSRKGHQRLASSCDIVTWYYGLGMALLAIAAPSLPCIFGITALFSRLGLMVAGGIILASFMTYASEHLAIRSFLKGLEDRDISRSRSACFLC